MLALALLFVPVIALRLVAVADVVGAGAGDRWLAVDDGGVAGFGVVVAAREREQQ